MSKNPNVEGLLEVQSRISKTLRYLQGVSKVTAEFPGYEGYFGKNRDFRHRDDSRETFKQGIQQILSKNPDSLGAAVAVSLWNALAPESQRISVDHRHDAIADKIRSKAPTANLNALARELINDYSKFTNEDLRDLIRTLDTLDKTIPGESLESPMENHEAVHANTVAKSDLRVENALTACIPEVNDSGARPEKVEVVSKLESPHPSAYDRELSIIRPLIARTREALSFRNELEFMHEYGLRRGLLDENALADVAYGSDRVFRAQDVIAAPSVHLGILLDESGSMIGHGDRVARQIAILLVEATHGLPGVNISVWGHTANHDLSEAVMMYRYIEHGDGEKYRIGNVHGRGNNLDGYAIGYCARRMLELSTPEESKILLVLSDGHPHGAIPGYGVYASTDHVTKVVNGARRAGIDVFGLGMGSLDEYAIKEMYGSRGGIACPNPSDLPQVMSKILAQALRTGHT